eukprot:gene57950-biopygen105096
MVAAPSGTTSNVLQLGLMLNFTTAELGLLRLTMAPHTPPGCVCGMAAWMLPTNDHALIDSLIPKDPNVGTILLIEILLGGDAYLPKTWNTAWGR